MTNKKHRLLVYILRAQPFHAGHRRVIELALEQCDHLLCLVGSAFQARTIKNPFTFEERMAMIQNSLDPQHLSRISIKPLRDNLYNENAWISSVQQLAKDTLSILPSRSSDNEIAIIGYDKDESSYYLKIFAPWDFVNVGRHYIDTIDATEIRSIWLSRKSARFFQSVVHESVFTFMTHHFKNEEYERLCDEYEHITNYKKQWANTPYPVIFTTVDAIVSCCGHILVVKRKASPGKGLFAAVGGFVNSNETLQQSMLRELDEETNIKLPPNLIKGSLVRSKTYDAVNRSLRGRTITHAFHLDLKNETKLPKVKGGDDAAQALWLSYSDFLQNEQMFFEDHFYMIRDMVGL